MRDGFAGIHARLDSLNGRVRKTETGQARHDERLRQQEERIGDLREERRVSVVTGAKYGGGLTAIIAGVPYVIEWIVKALS